LQIQIKRLHKDAVIPSYQKEGDAGLDLTAITRTFTEGPDYDYVEYGTGLAMEIPKGHVGLIYPRSSISKTGHILANSVGVIDSGYRGEVCLRFKTIPGMKQYDEFERVGQLMVVPYQVIHFEEVDELSTTQRGAGGFGSSGV
jgi:dUTP diphosphatase